MSKIILTEHEGHEGAAELLKKHFEQDTRFENYKVIISGKVIKNQDEVDLEKEKNFAIEQGELLRRKIEIKQS